MRVELEHVVPATPEAVFAVLSDPRMRPRWQDGTSDVALVSPPPVGVGSRWTETQRGVGHVDAEVTGFEPGARWAEAGETSAGTATVTVEMRPADGGTRLDVTVELKLRGARRLAEMALGPIVRSRMEADLERLSALLVADR